MFKPVLRDIFLLAVVNSIALFAMAQNESGEIEEVLVTGSQIKGASISDALPVSVIDIDDIEALGISSGDELLDNLAENGQNFVNEAENISGGVNSARGDTGAFNLRNLGTGNTLVLLNGRRLVNEASYQTEEVGGSFVPVNSVNSNNIPVFGVQRVEVLRDGASAIYGADAVAGVVNEVLKKDLDGFSIRTKISTYDHMPRDDQNVSLEWGKFFNNGATNVGLFLDYYQRDRVNSQDEDRWADADFRSRLPDGSPWASTTLFRNNSANSEFGQYDLRVSASSVGLRNVLTDSSGEFETYPLGDPRCQYTLNATTCGAIDGQGTFRHNLNENRDLVSELERSNLFVYLNHDMGNGAEFYSELAYYNAKTNLLRHSSAPFSTVKLEVGAANYYNPFGPCGSPNRLPDAVLGTGVPCSGLELLMDNYRFTQVPRIVDNDAKTWRVLAGMTGEVGPWNWDSALVFSRAERDDITRNRVSNTLMQEALNDPTPAAFNPFGGRVNTNIERALVDVQRLSESTLAMFDFKVSRADLFKLPTGGAVGALLGLELRRESFKDDRDDRLDGTIVFTDNEGDTYPFVSDVVNSSPTPDNSGDRNVTSLFGELQIPVLDNLDVQLAMRFEDFSDVENTTVGKVAAGWRPIERLLVRGSWSEAFRAPNLITINESFVARQNTRNDYLCVYAADNGGDPNQNVVDCRNSTQRIAQGSKSLVPEESTNYSFGLVYDPIDNLTLTLDFWSIEKENTIGLFGEENHTILELVNSLAAGTGNCGSLVANPAVVRDPNIPMDEAAIYAAAGLCPAGTIARIEDNYANFDTRTIRGHDIGIYYDVDTSFGNFNMRYVASFLDKYTQEAGGQAAILVAAQQAGTLPASIPVTGFSDLRRQNGNPESKHTARINWRNGPFTIAVSGLRNGDFYQDSLTLDDGTRYDVPAMTTYNMNFDYRFDMSGFDARLRFGIRNVGDERAPLADRYFGYFSDMHRDLGRSYYLDLKINN